MAKILITGAAGMIGSSTSKKLVELGHTVIGIDINLNTKPMTNVVYGDIRDMKDLEKNIEDVDGVIHLAAVSRVIFAQNNPELCFDTNIVGSNNVVRSALSSSKKPWLIYASSREVYGASDVLPVSENFALNPVNIYGKSKLAAELSFDAANHAGLKSAIVRFSNVYGWTEDHETRVIPAFLRASIKNDKLYVEGTDNTFDFVHISDATAGLIKVVEYMESEKTAFPKIHFVTGQATTLLELANKCVQIAGSGEIEMAPSRTFDVGKFYGNPSRAKEILGWDAKIQLSDGLKMFHEELKNKLLY